MFNIVFRKCLATGFFSNSAELQKEGHYLTVIISCCVLFYCSGRVDRPIPCPVLVIVLHSGKLSSVWFPSNPFLMASTSGEFRIWQQGTSRSLSIIIITVLRNSLFYFSWPKGSQWRSTPPLHCSSVSLQWSFTPKSSRQPNVTWGIKYCIY